MAPVRLQGQEWLRAVFVVRCIRHASIPQARPVHVRECQGVLVLALPAQGSVLRLEWRLRRVLQIVHRADMHSGVAETTAMRSRRKVR